MELIESARRGRVETVEKLLEKGTDVNIRDQYGQTALIWASTWDNRDMVEVLLRHNPAVDVKGLNGDTALIIAAAKGHATIVRALLHHGANPNVRGMYKNTALVRAAIHGDAECVEALIDGKADVDLADMNGYTPLMWAAEKGFQECVSPLLLGNAFVNARNSEGRTALMIAASHGHTRIVEMLLEEGAYAHFVSQAGLTARIEALGRGHDETVEALDRKLKQQEIDEPSMTLMSQGSTGGDSDLIESTTESIDLSTMDTVGSTGSHHPVFISSHTCKKDSLRDDSFALGLDEGTITALEDKAQQLEMQDLLGNVIPDLVTKLQPVFTDIKDRLSVKETTLTIHIDPDTEQMTRAEEFVFPGAGFFSMGPPPRISKFKGEVTLEGSYLFAGKIRLRTSKWYSVFSTELDPASPYVLTQIEEAEGFIMTATALLHNLSLQAARPLTSAADAYPVFDALEHITSQLRKARGCLTRPNREAFPNPCPTRDNAFAPPVPDDVVVEFSVRQSELLASAYALVKARPRKDSASSPSLKARKESVSSQSSLGFDSDVFMHKGQQMQVCDHQQVSLPVPDWGRALRRIQQAMALCLRVRDRVAAHFTYTT